MSSSIFPSSPPSPSLSLHPVNGTANDNALLDSSHLSQVSSAIHNAFNSNPDVAITGRPAFTPSQTILKSSSSSPSPYVFRCRRLPSDAPSFSSYLDQLDTNGYVILPNLLSDTQLNAIRSSLEEIHSSSHPSSKMGRNRFEGKSTRRVYGTTLLSTSRNYDVMATHPLILSLIDRILYANYLITAFQSIDIYGGEKRQPLHYDDSFIYFPRPRPPVSMATIWGITKFTKENGGTVVIPGSHSWGEEIPTDSAVKNKIKLISVEMNEGDCVLFVGTLWHGGGESFVPRDHSSSPRMAVSIQYCEAFIRPQENLLYGVNEKVINTMDDKMKQMLGLSIHSPFIGHVDGQHPVKRFRERMKNSEETDTLRGKYSENEEKESGNSNSLSSMSKL